MNLILMADIIDSSERKAKALMKDFKEVVDSVNKQNKRDILSPLTITLGDEFQGIVRTQQSAIEIIFNLEAHLMALKKPFKLRYVVYEGEIQTQLNKQRAYEMLGPGLTDAREKLISLKSSRNRFHISFRDTALSEKLNLMFQIAQGIMDQWTDAQKKIALAFLEWNDYRKVAEKLKKDPTSIWRRKKSLMIDEFNSLKKLMYLTINPKWQP
jgi:SatD family (SatD)